MKPVYAYLLAALAAFAAGCSQPRYVTIDGAMLGTTFHVVARTSAPAPRLYAGMMRIDAEMKASMSIFDPASRLSRINAGVTDTLDCHILRNIAVAGEINRISGGFYDITVKPLTEAYGFAGGEGADNPDLDSLLRFVGFDRFHIEGSRIVKDDARVQIDLNSIAKGYTVDLAAGFLESVGCSDYIVEIGGEIRARGVNPRGERWRVAVDSPFDGNSSPGEFRQTVVEVNDCAMATSGNYRRFRTDACGRRINHTIDPRTGRSVCSRLLSATVIARDCMRADALGTMFMAMGDERAIAAATAMRDSVRVYFILAPRAADGSAANAAAGATEEGAVGGQGAAVAEPQEYEIFSTLGGGAVNEKVR